MSPSLQQQQVIAALELTPAQRQALELQLSVYADVLQDFELLESALDREQAAVGKILADAGVKSYDSEHFIAYWTRDGKTRKLITEKLIAQGVTKAQIEAATVEKPKKDSFTIRARAAKAGNRDDA